MSVVNPPGDHFRPLSSAKERPVFNREVPGSSPGAGSTTYQYIIVRKELAGGALLAMVAHAAGESVPAAGLPNDTRVVVLVATKAQMETISGWADAAHGIGSPLSGYAKVLETDGPLTGSYPSIGMVTTDRDFLRRELPLLAELKPWRG